MSLSIIDNNFVWVDEMGGRPNDPAPTNFLNKDFNRNLAFRAQSVFLFLIKAKIHI
jgi:hypothetical protein